MRSPMVLAAFACVALCACAAHSPGIRGGGSSVAPAPPQQAADDFNPPDDPAAAVRYFEARLVRTPNDVEWWQRLTSALRHLNRLQEAARAGWRAVELAPRWESWTNLGNVLMQGHARLGALVSFEMAALKTPDPDAAARNFLNLGYEDWMFDDPASSAQAIDRAEKASPKNPQVFYDRASLLAGTGRIEEARPVARHALELLAPIDVAKLPTEPARQSVTLMRTFLERLAAGDKTVTRPPVSDSGQVLPERFVKDVLGHALALVIDPSSYRLYPVGHDRVFRVEVPSRWNETLQVTDEQTDVKLAAEDVPPHAVLQLTALTPPANIDLRAATEKGAAVVRQGGGIVEATQPVGKLGFWFWSTDPHAKPGNPNDFPYLAQSFSQAPGALLSVTLLTRADSHEERSFLPKLLASAGVRSIGRPPTTGEASSAR